MAVVLVTGSSSGFGLLTCCELARRGDEVFASMRDPGRAGPLEEALAADGSSARVVQLDVTDPESAARAVDHVAEQAGRLDVVVNNAGTGSGGPVEEMPLTEIRAMFDTNVFGAVGLIQAALPLMRRQRSGHIVDVTSLAAFVAPPFMAAYAATKHALDAFGEALAVEVAPFGIHVTNVAPAAYLTPMIEGLTSAPADDGGSAYAERLRTVLEHHADSMRANHDPTEVAVAVADAIHSAPPPARVVVPRRDAFIVEGRGSAPPEALRAAVGQF
jgi:NAD(P)-dependent dehydrogenase (short-subunit alcohol dehydrogenase family)